MKIRAPLLLSALILFLPVAADAAAGPARGFDIVSSYVGGGAGYMPRYPGSKEYRAVPLFNASVLFENGLFADGQQGVGYRQKFTDSFYAFAALSMDAGRKDKADALRPGADRLRGMGDIEASALANVGLGYRFGDRASLGLVASKPLKHADYGANAHLVGHLAVWKGVRDGIDLDAAVHYGNRDYNQTWFGVTAVQAARTGFTRHAPAAGIYAADASVTWSHQFGEHWFTRLAGGATRYMQRVASGPLVQERTSYTLAVSLNYRF